MTNLVQLQALTLENYKKKIIVDKNNQSNLLSQIQKDNNYSDKKFLISRIKKRIDLIQNEIDQEIPQEEPEEEQENEVKLKEIKIIDKPEKKTENKEIIRDKSQHLDNTNKMIHNIRTLNSIDKTKIKYKDLYEQTMELFNEYLKAKHYFEKV